MSETERMKQLDKLIANFTVKLKKVRSCMIEALLRMCYIQRQHLMIDKCERCLDLIREQPKLHLHLINESINQLQEVLNFLEKEVGK